MALAVRGGANLPAIWCDWLLGRRDSPFAVARAGLHYRWEEAEARNLVSSIRRGDIRSAAEVVRPYRPVVRAFFQANDPAPVLARPLYLARRTVARLADRLRPPSRPA